MQLFNLLLGALSGYLPSIVGYDATCDPLISYL